MTVAVVTGANSGLGRSAAIELASRGWTVYGTMRSLDKGNKLAVMAERAGVEVTPVVCDITDGPSVEHAIAEVLANSGGIDVLVNNAGIGGNGVVEESPVEGYAAVMDVNLYGAIRCIQAVLPHMRQNGAGTIVNVTSVAGRFAAIGQSPYVASKWALEGLSENLAQEVAPFGIRVVIVEPGVVKTAILAKATDSPNHSGAYDSAYRRMFAFYAAALAADADESCLTDGPEALGKTVFDAVTAAEPRLRWTFGWGGEELLKGRERMSDADWVSLGAIEGDEEYSTRFEQLMGVDLRPGFEALS